MTIEEARTSIYFTARPRPWEIGFRDRGLGHGDYAVLDSLGSLVVETSHRSDAELIVAAINAYKP